MYLEYVGFEYLGYEEHPIEIGLSYIIEVIGIKKCYTNCQLMLKAFHTQTRDNVRRLCLLL